MIGRRGLPVGVVAVLLHCGIASAQVSLQWNGGGGNGNWSNTGNWTTGTAPSNPGTTYQLLFLGNSQTATTNDLGTVNVQSLTFGNTGGVNTGSFSIDSGTLNFAANSTITGSSATSLLNIEGDRINSAMVLSGTTTVTSGTNHSISLLGQISGVGGALVINASALATGNPAPYVYISGSNSYTGGTLIQGGFVQTSSRAGANDNTGTSVFGTGSVTVSGSGTLLVRNNTIVNNAITLSGTGVNGNNLTGSFGIANGVAQVTGPITLAGDAVISTASAVNSDSSSRLVIGGTSGSPSTVDLGSNTLTFRPGRTAGTPTSGLLIDVTSSIIGAGNVSLSGTTPLSRLQLSGSNTYTGTTTITTGTLIVNNSSALGNKAALVVNTNGLDLNGYTVTSGALSGSSSGVIQSSSSVASRLITDTVTSSTYAGVIRNNPNDSNGTVGLTKAGSGSLTLTNANTYTGSTSVIGGRLFVNGSLGVTDTTVQTAGTLSGTGSIGGSVTVLSGGTLAPGATSDPSYGTLSIGGNLNLMTGAVTTMEISGTGAGLFDKLAIATTGTVNFGGTLNVSMNYNGVVFGSQASPFTGDQWQLFSSTDQAFSGDFLSILLSGSYGNVSFYEYGNSGEWHADTPSGEFAFFTSGPRAGILYAVPEPATLTLAGSAIGMLGLAGWRRARKRSRAAA